MLILWLLKFILIDRFGQCVINVGRVGVICIMLKDMGVFICSVLCGLFCSCDIFVLVFLIFCKFIWLCLQKVLFILVRFSWRVVWLNNCVLRWFFSFVIYLLIIDLDSESCLVVVVKLLFFIIWVKMAILFKMFICRVYYLKFVNNYILKSLIIGFFKVIIVIFC